MKILIAEDDLTSRTMLQAALNKWGYEVVSTADSDEAWAALQQGDEGDAPQLAILDWIMPGMTGPERNRSRATIALTCK
jgi:DNA-binding response OmpR family regulator